MPYNERAADAKIRRAASKLNLTIRKSRWRLGSVDNYGGYQVADAHTGTVDCGERFQLSLADVSARLAHVAREQRLTALASSLDQLKRSLEEGATHS